MSQLRTMALDTATCRARGRDPLPMADSRRIASNPASKQRPPGRRRSLIESIPAGSAGTDMNSEKRWAGTRLASVSGRRESAEVGQACQHVTAERN